MPADDDPLPPAAPADAEPVEPPPPVSLMITRRQKEALRALGYGEEAIREMRPAEAHALLGL